LRGRAEPRDGAVLEHTQQLDLLIVGKIAYFVEEQCAAVGLLEIPFVREHSTRERTLRVAEEQRLEQAVGDRPAIDRDKRAIAVAGIPFMKQLRDALLADAGLPMDQHARVAIGKRLGLAQEGLHRLGIRDQRSRGLGSSAMGAHLQSELRHHAAEFGAGEVGRENMRILGRIQRRIMGTTFSIAGQYSHDALPSSEQIAFGGPRFGRGYQPGETAGDPGWGASIELNRAFAIGWTYLQAVQPYIEFDTARVYLHAGPTYPSRLASVALSMRFGDLHHYSLDLAVGKPVGDAPTESASRSPRVNANFSYNFE
jgi:hypothetical protein